MSDQPLQHKLSQAVALYQQGRPSHAERICREVLQHESDNFDALHLLGVIMLRTRRAERAIQILEKAITLRPGSVEAHYNRGLALKDLKRPEQALASFEMAITLKPDFSEAYVNRGNTLQNLKQPEEALVSYNKAIALRPDFAQAYNSRGNSLDALNRIAEALESYNKAIALNPSFAEAHNNRGNALTALNKYEEALASYDQAIAVKPTFPEAYSNRGNVLNSLGRYEEALSNCNKAIALSPNLIEAYVNRGDVLRNLRSADQAIVSFEAALQLEPEYEFLFGELMYTKMIICDWSNIDTQFNQLVRKVRIGEKVSKPFPVLAISNSPELQREVAEIYALAKYPPKNVLPPLPKRPQRNKIRVGYFSSDFRDHPGAYSMVEMFERHDRSKFEIVGFSFSPSCSHELKSRLESAFDKFIDINRFSDLDAARLTRALEIDIAIDRNGYTTFCRPNIFATRAAPLQVSFKAYPSTMGTNYIDYLVADHVVIPREHQQYYCEKIAYLPHSYQVYDTTRAVLDRPDTREQNGLTQKSFVFCCFNSNYKITPTVFNCWMQILKKADSSVLWLLESNAHAAANLRKEAGARGVNPDRLVFAKPVSLSDHLARHHLADLFLDTLPYNAHTTASDALWTGLPVLTQIGETFAGRVAASLLTAIGLPELITSTPQAYAGLAVELATNPAMLAAIKQRLANNRQTAPLFDTKLFTKHIEAAYIAMYERYQAGLPPDHIAVSQ